MTEIKSNWTEEKLDGMLTTPSQSLIGDMKRIDGDIMILGAGGKMGPTLAVLAKRALAAAGSCGRVIAVSRFSDPLALKLLKDNGVDTLSLDLMDPGAMDKLPDAENVIYMAGRKFGTAGQEYLTWAMNAWLPSRVAERCRKSSIVVFSSGNIYPFVPVYAGGADETVTPQPKGEYAMSCLARERMFEYAANTYQTKIAMYRLNYAVDLRYGVLYDIASKIMAGQPVSVTMPCFNCIWQGEANEIAIRALLHTATPAAYINVTGPETVSVRYAAQKMAGYLGKEAVFEGEESSDVLLNNSSKAMELFGYPSVSVETLLRWQAEWVLSGGRALGKPTHFEERKGKF